MRNRLVDVDDILVEQLERLNDLDEDEMKGDKLKNEIARARAISGIAAPIINGRRLALDAIKLSVELPKGVEIPDALKHKKPEALPPPPGSKK